MTAQAALKLSIPAGADLSATPHRFVTLTAGKLALAGAGGAVVGVLTNKPAAADRPGLVTIAGEEDVEVGGSVTVDDYVKSDAVGRAVTASASDVLAGRAKGKAMATASSGHVKCHVFPGPAVAGVSGVESVIAPGAISVATEVTLLSVDGTDAYTLASGLYDGQIKEILCVAAANTPAGTITGAFLDVATARTTALFNETSDYLRLRWSTTLAAWQVMQATSITFG